MTAEIYHDKNQTTGTTMTIDETKHVSLATPVNPGTELTTMLILGFGLMRLAGDEKDKKII
jgi:hypothetical protein